MQIMPELYQHAELTPGLSVQNSSKPTKLNAFTTVTHERLSSFDAQLLIPTHSFAPSLILMEDACALLREALDAPSFAGAAPFPPVYIAHVNITFAPAHVRYASYVSCHIIVTCPCDSLQAVTQLLLPTIDPRKHDPCTSRYPGVNHPHREQQPAAEAALEPPPKIIGCSSCSITCQTDFQYLTSETLRLSLRLIVGQI